MSSQTLFKISNVYRAAEGLRILSDINLTIQSGEFVALLGASGSGKTSLLRLFNALDAPTRGTMEYHGKNADKWDISLLRQQVGMVFQEPVVLAGTVQENLLLPSRWNKSTDEYHPADLFNTLEKVGLQNVELVTDARSLSSGEKQRLALARVLLNRPQVLLLDEPTASLDPSLARRIVQRIADLHSGMNLTVIMVSHDPQLVRRFAKRVVFMHEGRIGEDGDVSIMEQPQTEALHHYLAEEH